MRPPDGKNLRSAASLHLIAALSDKENTMIRNLRPSPALVVAGLALFFAVGGSAFAVVNKTAVAQPRCSAGAVRGVAWVTGVPSQGIGNLPEAWQTGNQFFGGRFNCSGGAVQVRRDGNGTDVRFVGNASIVATATPVQGSAAGISVLRLSDGSFHVETAGDAPDSSFPNRPIPFVIVLY
jgi:hypothetical protein